VAIEQLDAELRLEPANLRRQSRLSDPQALGSAREAALFRDRDEVAEMTEFHCHLLTPPAE
jgi:hypothetical protein